LAAFALIALLSGQQQTIAWRAPWVEGQLQVSLLVFLLQ
jgi:hypothetical protein